MRVLLATILYQAISFREKPLAGVAKPGIRLCCLLTQYIHSPGLEIRLCPLRECFDAELPLVS